MKWFYVFLILLLTQYSIAETTRTSYKNCKALSEFKEVHLFLKTTKLIELNEAQLIKSSLNISSGCDGSAKRFIKTFKMLDSAGVDLKKSFETATKLAHSSDLQADIFMETFKGLFLENKFDFSFEESFEWAFLYAQTPKSKQTPFQSDFKKILTFCLSQEIAALPLKLCRDYSLQILKIVAQEDRKSTYSDFLKLFHFLIEKNGPSFPIEQSLNITLQILNIGDNAANEFIDGFKYANSKQGLNLNTLQSYKFALSLSQNSIQKND